METQVVELLGGEQVLGASFRSNLDLVRATRAGLPAEAMVRLRRLILGSTDDIEPDASVPGSGLGLWLVEALNLAPKPPHANSDEEEIARLTPEQSDVVVRTATVFARAIDVLGDKKKAAHWLTTPNRALGGIIPITLLDTSAGAHEAETILDRIEYGVYS